MRLTPLVNDRCRVRRSRYCSWFLNHALRETGNFHADMASGHLKVAPNGEFHRLDFGIMGQIANTPAAFIRDPVGFYPQRLQTLQRCTSKPAYGAADKTSTIRPLPCAPWGSLFSYGRDRRIFDGAAAEPICRGHRNFGGTRTELILLQRTWPREGVARFAQSRNINIWEVSNPIVTVTS